MTSFIYNVCEWIFKICTLKYKGQKYFYFNKFHQFVYVEVSIKLGKQKLKLPNVIRIQINMY